jgi:hypothetical protein
MDLAEGILQKINKSMDEISEDTESSGIIISPDVLKYFENSNNYKDGVYSYNNTSIPVVVSDLLEKNTILSMGKSNNNNANPICYGNLPVYTPPLRSAPVGFKKTKIKLNRSVLKENITCVERTDNMLHFNLSFLKNKDSEYLYEEYDNLDLKSEISIDLSKAYKDSFGFKYRNLDIWYRKDDETKNICSIKIHDSYKGLCDCIGYMHGIYRDEKYSCYNVHVSLEDGSIYSDEVEII